MNKENEKEIEFDNIDEFKSSDITVIEGTSIILNILFKLCIKSIVSFNKDVLYIDGHNTFDPYIIQRMIKPLRVDQKDILSRIHIVRAFTEYQMEDIIKGLENKIKETNAGVLIVSYMTSVFYNYYENRPNRSRKKLLDSLIKHIRLMTTSSKLITVITSYGDFCFEDKMLASRADRVINIEKINKVVTIVDNGIVLKQVQVSNGQTRFSDFV